MIKIRTENVGNRFSLTPILMTYDHSADIDVQCFDHFCCDFMKRAIAHEGAPFYFHDGRMVLRVNPKVLDDDSDCIEELEITNCPFCMSIIDIQFIGPRAKEMRSR
jgi:hypothetical protein